MPWKGSRTTVKYDGRIRDLKEAIDALQKIQGDDVLSIQNADRESKTDSRGSRATMKPPGGFVRCGG